MGWQENAQVAQGQAQVEALRRMQEAQGIAPPQTAMNRAGNRLLFWVCVIGGCLLPPLWVIPWLQARRRRAYEEPLRTAPMVPSPIGWVPNPSVSTSPPAPFDPKTENSDYNKGDPAVGA